MITVYAIPAERTSPRFARAFATGCGGRVVTTRQHVDGPIALFGSPHLMEVLERARDEGRDWYYGDHAYFGRFRFFRITKNALQHTGEGKGDARRFDRLGVSIEPWKKGRHVLVCPPDRKYARCIGMDEQAWLRGTLAALKRHTDRPIRIRKREGAEKNPVTLANDLQGAHALVTHHSNAAVEALCMGVPVFVTAQCAARAMAETDLTKIESPRYPDDRLRWASVLAANQWSIAEIRRGQAWRALK